MCLYLSRLYCINGVTVGVSNVSIGHLPLVPLPLVWVWQHGLVLGGVGGLGGVGRAVVAVVGILRPVEGEAGVLVAVVVPRPAPLLAEVDVVGGVGRHYLPRVLCLSCLLLWL